MHYQSEILALLFIFQHTFNLSICSEHLKTGKLCLKENYSRSGGGKAKTEKNQKESFKIYQFNSRKCSDSLSSEQKFHTMNIHVLVSFCAQKRYTSFTTDLFVKFITDAFYVVLRELLNCIRFPG